jgi:septin family protein
MVLLSCFGGGYAQSYGEKAQNKATGAYNESGRMEMPTIPTVYEMTDEVRNKLNLDHTLFDKVYQAYDKFNNAIFGSDKSSSGMGEGGPGGRGGMRGGPGGGMGGPGGMGAPGGGMQGGPGGMGGGPMGNDMRANKSQQKEKAPKELSEKELKKRQQKIEKQEQNLAKKMSQILKDEAKYQQWLKIREQQLKRMFPHQPGE